MSVFYLEEHRACRNYISDYSIGFKACPIKQGECITSFDKKSHCLFFLIAGSIDIYYESQTHRLNKGKVWLVPMSSDFKIQANADSLLVINYFNKPIDSCEKSALESLAALIDQSVPLCLLQVNKPLKSFLSSMIFYLKEGSYCKHFHEIKQKELFYILRYFYTKKEIASLFAPILSKNLDFKNIVLANYLYAGSVKELAQMCNCSLSTFNRLFKNNFRDCSPLPPVMLPFCIYLH